MFLHLLNGEVAKVPVTLLLNQSCNDKFLEMIQPDDTRILYKGVEVYAHYCKKGTGEYVR